MAARNPDILGRFWSKVQIRPEAECWEWRQGRPDAVPTYGRFRILPGFRAIGAHRFAWILANRRDVPDGLVVMHSCDNKRCVNPAHLSLGTVSDNTKDATAKGLNDPSKARAARIRPSCPQGHPYDEANTSTWKGQRKCRTCHRQREALRRAA